MKGENSKYPFLYDLSLNKRLDRFQIVSPNYFIFDELNRGRPTVSQYPVYFTNIVPKQMDRFQILFHHFQNVLFRWAGQWVVPPPVHRTLMNWIGTLAIGMWRSNEHAGRNIVWSLYVLNLTFVFQSSSQETYTTQCYVVNIKSTSTQLCSRVIVVTMTTIIPASTFVLRVLTTSQPLCNVFRVSSVCPKKGSTKLFCLWLLPTRNKMVECEGTG